MKLSTIALAGLMAAATVHPAHADDDWLTTQQGATFLGATAVGVALGGPFGMIGGALLGAWYNDRLEDAASLPAAHDELSSTRYELAETRSELAVSQAQLADVREANLEYAQLVLDQLQLEMLFKTGATELTPGGHMRLATLAAFLVENPGIAIRLDGYADPRGDASYNQQLSLGRVSHVAQALEDYGVDPERIARFSHGDGESVAKEGDLDAYALERAVKINLSQTESVAVTQR